MASITDITGVLLAGGLSRRMFADAGGTDARGPAHGTKGATGTTSKAQRAGDKCLADLVGRPMLAHVIDRLAPQVARLVLNANGDPARFDAFALPVAADPIEGFAGPLAGILAGMVWAQSHAPQCSHIASVSTDAPFIPDDLVARLADALDSSGAAIALASSGGHLHPVIGLWPVALAHDLQEQLRLGTRKVLHWTDRHGIVAVQFQPALIGNQQIDPFFNANRPDELDEARRLLGAGATDH